MVLSCNQVYNSRKTFNQVSLLGFYKLHLSKEKYCAVRDDPVGEGQYICIYEAYETWNKKKNYSYKYSFRINIFPYCHYLYQTRSNSIWKTKLSVLVKNFRIFFNWYKYSFLMNVSCHYIKVVSMPSQIIKPCTELTNRVLDKFF